MASINDRPRLRGRTEAALVLGFVSILAVIILIAASSYRNVQQIVDNAAKVRHTHDVLRTIEGVQSSLNASESALRGFLVSGNEEQLGVFQSSLDDARRHKATLVRQTQDNPKQQELLSGFDDLLARREDWQRELIDIRRTQGVEAISKIRAPEAQAVRKELFDLLVAGALEEEKLMEMRQIKANQSIRTATVNFWIGTGLAVALLFGFFYMVRRAVEYQATLRAEENRHRAELEQRVQERTEELILINRGLEAFSYSVSHDLRAPLRAIGVNASMLTEDASENLTDDDRENLSRINLGVSRMSAIIDGLLNLSRITREKPAKEDVDLSELATQAGNEASAGRKQAADLKVEPNMRIAADKRLMTILMVNLIGNAFKYSAGVASPRVEVGTTTVEGERAFFVKDNGVGFDQQFAGRMFEPFQRLHGEDEFAGSGIGLATCEAIVHRHGGRIWAEGKVGEGATFYFTLPSPANAPD